MKKNVMIILISVLSVLVVGLGVFIIYDKVINKDKSSISNEQTENKDVVENNNSDDNQKEDESKKMTIEEYISLIEQYNDKVIVVNNLEDVYTEYLKIDTIDKMRAFSKYLENNSAFANARPDNPDIRYFDENYLIRLAFYFIKTKNTEYSNNTCVKKEILDNVIYDVFDRSDIKGDNFLDVEGYYCNGPGGGSSTFKFYSENSYVKDDIYTYIYEYRNEKIKLVIETRFKYIDGLYKLIYYSATDSNIN